MTAAARVGILMLCKIPAMAQSVGSTQAGTIEFTQGDVYVDDQPVRAGGTRFPAVKDGQTLRTGRGLVEVLLAPEIFLRLGSGSSFRMVTSSLEDTRVELRKGTALIEVVDMVKGGRTQIEDGQTGTEFKGTGLYRFESDRHELLVFGGKAEVRTGDKTATAGRGRAVQLSGSLLISKFDPKRVDALHKWAAARSFRSFTSSDEEQARRTDWEINVTGWFWNPNFDMKFFSAKAAAAYRSRRDAKQREKAAFDQILKSY